MNYILIGKDMTEQVLMTKDGMDYIIRPCEHCGSKDFTIGDIIEGELKPLYLDQGKYSVYAICTVCLERAPISLRKVK
jgi:hypothetical protein